MGHFGIKKKLKNVTFLFFKFFFRVCRLGLVAAGRDADFEFSLSSTLLPY